MLGEFHIYAKHTSGAWLATVAAELNISITVSVNMICAKSMRGESLGYIMHDEFFENVQAEFSYLQWDTVVKPSVTVTIER